MGAGLLEAAITPRTRWLILNSPSNPTGASYTAGDADHPFTLMSVCKPFTFALVCQALGAELASAAQQATASASEGLSAQEAELTSALTSPGLAGL